MTKLMIRSSDTVNHGAEQLNHEHFSEQLYLEVLAGNSSTMNRRSA